MDGNALCYSRMGEKQCGCSVRNIPLITGDFFVGAGEGDSGCFRFFECDGIAERDRLHHHLEQLIAVVPFSGDVQGEVDLRAGVENDLFHGAGPSFLSGMGRAGAGRFLTICIAFSFRIRYTVDRTKESEREDRTMKGKAIVIFSACVIAAVSLSMAKPI